MSERLVALVTLHGLAAQVSAHQRVETGQLTESFVSAAAAAAAVATTVFAAFGKAAVAAFRRAATTAATAAALGLLL